MRRSKSASTELAVVGLLIWLERRARKRARFVSSRALPSASTEAQPLPLRGLRAAAAMLACATPVLLGFVLPVLVLVRLMGQEFETALVQVPLERFVRSAWVSFKLASIAACAATLVAAVLAFTLRTRPNRPLRWAVGMVSLGYAVPGAVVAVGILLPLGWLQQALPQWHASALVTGTLLGVLFAYQVRFSSVALQSLESGYARIPPAMDESARLLGVARWRLLARVHAPLLRRAALAALLLVFVDVMKELPATLVLRPFNSDTLAVMAYQLARDERLGEAALPSLAIVLVGLLPVMLLSRAMRR